MATAVQTTITDEAESWVAAFDGALSRKDVPGIASLLATDSHWRNLGGISWPLRTFSGATTIAGELCERAGQVGASGFSLDAETLRPRENFVGGRDVIEAVIRFQTDNGPGEGVVRLVPSGDGQAPKAWTLSTGLDINKICKERALRREPESHSRDFAEPSWREKRETELAYADREPEVLVIGGGHAGCTAAAELKRLGHDVLIIDREKRVGDNWRLRYEGLKLHNRTPINHLRYMAFPITAPDYLPKEKVASWLEAYVENMDINFWTETTFESGSYDEKTGTWTIRVSRGDGSSRELHPKHVVIATSVSGTPNIPEMPTLETFEGTVVHSSRFVSGDQWKGRSTVVVGTGTSAHDIAQELHASGARVTMVQRSPTLVVNVEPAQLYDQIYLDDGPPFEVRDLLNSSIPYPVARLNHQRITKKVKELDRPLLERLERAGFRLDFGEDETGWPLKFRNRGGGYYLNVGCSDLIAEGEIRLVQADDIDRFVAEGIQMSDGSIIEAELVVLATGYKGLGHFVRERFGAEIAERAGTVWGIDPQYHELRNMWTKTGQPGLWFTGGAFSMCRIYSRIMALQIDAIEDGRLEK